MLATTALTWRILGQSHSAALQAQHRRTRAQLYNHLAGAPPSVLHQLGGLGRSALGQQGLQRPAAHLCGACGPRREQRSSHSERRSRSR